MPVRTQSNRVAAIGTPLGDDVLLLVGLAGTEQLGRPFQYDVELSSENASIDFDQMVGQNVTVRFEQQNSETRYFNGFVSRFVQTSADDRLAKYRATIVPWLWFLTRTSDCRIFQNQTVPDIVKQVFTDNGFTDVDEHLSGTYTPWEYCVQYRETDFNFVSRLLEQEGIYYFFKHEDGKHTLVLCDSPAAHTTADGYESVEYRHASADSATGFVSTWSLSRQVEPGTYALNEFDFNKPRASLVGKSQVPRGDAHPDAEVYDYPGEYESVSDGEEWAKVRIQEMQARYEVASATTDAAGLATGYTFSLTDYPRDDQNRSYLITSSSCQITGDGYGAGGGGGGGGAGGPIFSCHFTAIDAQTNFRPGRVTPKPTVQGPQTAIVVGPSGQEIYTDPNGLGMVKLQFHWDRYGQANEQSSCWVRTSQVWAGKTWGAMYIPRIGQEVVVDFLEGDPDRPLITGRVYNAENKPPYPLPDNNTISGIKSNSSPGGGGFNEIRFEDKKGSEQVFIHGEKNQDIRIKNDCMEWIGHDRHLVVKNSQFEHIDTDRNETIDRDHIEEIGRDRNTTIEGKEAKAVTGTFSLKVGGNVAEEFQGNHSEKVTNDYYLKADNIVIEGLSNVTIKVGSNFIAIGPDGIKISSTGTMDVLSTGPMKAQSQATAEVSGTAMLTLKGGVVMIN
jgi:type VI secretion system secreted protein VgrG